jgi:hypothetical protein
MSLGPSAPFERRFPSSCEYPWALGNLLGDLSLGRREAMPAVLALAAATD